MSHQLFAYGTGVNGNFSYNGSFGSQLTTTSAIQITALGAFLDSAAGAWTANKILQIWNSAGTTVLATVTIAPADIGVTATLTNGYVLKTLTTPITIATSTTFTLAAYGYGVDKFINQGQASPTAPTVDLSSGTLTLANAAYFSSTTGSATFPGTTTSGQNFGGPTFVYGPVPTATLALSVNSGTVVDASTTLSTTPTLSNSTATLTASVTSGLGTISSGPYASGSPIIYTPPTTGSGTAIVTVSDTTDGLSQTCTITYAPAVTAVINVSPVTATSTATSVVSITATRTGGTGALGVTTSSGTLSSPPYLSTTPFTVTLPAGSGTTVVTVTDTSDGATPKTSTITYTPAPTSYTLSDSPTSGVAGTTSTITATLAPAGSIAGTAYTITLSDSGGGGSFNTPITIAVGASTGTATYTCAGSSGSRAISATHTGGDFAGSDGSATFTVSAGATVLSPNNAAITYSPFNWNVQSTFAQTVNTGAYFDLLFTGTSITLAFDTTTNSLAGSLCWYRVDGGAWVLWTYATSLAVTSLTNNKHLFEFVYTATTINSNRWNTGQKSGIYLTSITLDTSATASATTKAPYNVLIYGDSITEGYEIKGTGGQPGQNDALACWSYTMRELLGANVGVVGFGSQGWTQAGQGNVPVLPSAYNLIYAGVSRIFNAPYPDLIIIAHGANDSAGTVTTIGNAMSPVLSALKTACPSAKILVLSPLNGTAQSAVQTGAAAASVSYANAQGVGLVGADYADGSLHPWGASSRAIYAPWVAGQVKTMSLLGSGGTAASYPRSTRSMNGGYNS